MTLSTGGGRRRQLMRGLAFVGVAAAGYAFGVTSDRAAAQQPGQPGALPGTPTLPAGTPMLQPAPKAAPLPTGEPDRRVTAYIYGNVPITREELGEFLIARGGHEKLELLVNKKIIEVEAARRGITVTPIEIQGKLDEIVRDLGINKKDFIQHMLPRTGKTLFEYTEDVLRPQLLLTKMCQGRVKVTDEDVLKTFENRFGERRAAQIICWNQQDLRTAQKQWAEARKGDAEFDAVAKQQADPNLAAACGRVKPLGKHPEGGDDIVVKTLYSMKPGEISGILEVNSGLMCIKYTALVPPEEGVKFDDKTKAALFKELSARKLEQEIPKVFLELKTAAKPQVYLKGPPTEAEFREGVSNIIDQAGGVPKLPMPKP